MDTKENQVINFKIKVVVEPDGDQFHAYCPALKGLHAPGDTVEEALHNALDAAECYIQSMIQLGDPIPVGPDLISTVSVQQNKETKSPVKRHSEYSEDVRVSLGVACV